MKVKELLMQLQECDPESEVSVQDLDNGSFYFENQIGAVYSDNIFTIWFSGFIEEEP